MADESEQISDDGNGIKYRVNFIFGEAKFEKPQFKIEHRSDGYWIAGDYISIGPFDLTEAVAHRVYLNQL